LKTGSVFDLERGELEGLLEKMGEHPYRAHQIWQGLYVQLAPSYDSITSLSKKLRSNLTQHLPLGEPRIVDKIESTDKRTCKLLLELSDKETIETVLMRYEKRYTICVSTQVGCSMGCAFCATARNGFTRNLSPGEIVSQVLIFARFLMLQGKQITNIVYMGMGEPFLNYSAVMKSIRILNHHEGFNLGARSFTVSTVGIIPGIELFTEENSQVNLAVSLHAGDDKLRTQLVPINRTYPLSKLITACRNYIDKTHRRLTFEIALIEDVNDSINDAQKVANLLADLACHVNLIPLNPIPELTFRPSPRQRVDSFARKLMDAGISTTVRVERGVSIAAGCGQLRGKQK
jgi:23S rRNA (adenine2503-C2)-methyltransferase